MWTLLIVLAPPSINEHLGFRATFKLISVQAFKPEMAVETLDKRVFPRAARRDVKGLAVACR